ncbi:MAG: acyl-CoA reductase, partial [Bacteroidota bacterium]
AQEAIAKAFLAEDQLRKWAAKYAITADQKEETVGIVMAGNIPLVGFHDFLCSFISGYRVQVKLSDKDQFVFPYLISQLQKIEPSLKERIQFVPKLGQFDRVIATGSNNTARYFEAYFGKYPHIIRRNRNGVAVLSGEETDEELKALGEDIFTYFGLGCRNVSKLYVPQGYDFEPLLNVFHEWRQLQNHPKYKNNFDYHYALLTVNREHFLSNGAIILRKDKALLSHIAGLYYEHYTDLADVQIELHQRREEIQLIAAKPGLLSLDTKNFGEAQQPGLMDYADGVDTMNWLVGL